MVRGLGLMSCSFALLAAAAVWPPPAGSPFALAPVLSCVLLLTIGGLMVFPFEMATIGALSGDHLLGTYYGFYGMCSALGILLGNLALGAALDGAGSAPAAAPWLLLVGIGAASALTLRRLDRRQLLDPAAAAAPPTGRPASSAGRNVRGARTDGS
jgi:hypothetical protein